MSARSLASALKDFGARSSPADPFLAMPSPGEQAFHLPLVEAAPFEPAPDVDALIAEAVAEAEQALSARLASEHAEAQRIEREQHQEELAAVHAQIAEEASNRIQAAIDQAEQHLVELTSAVAGRILGSLLSDDMRERSLERLAATIREAFRDSDAVRIRIRGSLPLYEALQARLDRSADQLEFTEGPSLDLSVTIDDSVYETRLAEWSAALAEALA